MCFFFFQYFGSEHVRWSRKSRKCFLIISTSRIATDRSKIKIAKIGLPFSCEGCTSTQPHVKSDAYMCRKCYAFCKYRPPVTTLCWSVGGLLQSKLSAFPIYLMHPHFSVIVSIFQTFISNSLYRYYGVIPLVRQPLFRQPTIPTTHYSDSPLFRQLIIPTMHFSYVYSLKRPTPFSIIFVVVRFDSNYSFHAGYLSQYIGVDTHAYCSCSVLTLVPLSFYVSRYFICLYISSFVCPVSLCCSSSLCLFCVLIYLISLDRRFPAFVYHGSEVSPPLTT